MYIGNVFGVRTFNLTFSPKVQNTMKHSESKSKNNVAKNNLSDFKNPILVCLNLSILIFAIHISIFHIVSSNSKETDSVVSMCNGHELLMTFIHQHLPPFIRLLKFIHFKDFFSNALINPFNTLCKYIFKDLLNYMCVCVYLCTYNNHKANSLVTMSWPTYI